MSDSGSTRETCGRSAAKSGETIGSDFTRSLDALARALRQRQPERAVHTRVVYGGDMRQTRGETAILPWRAVEALA